MSVFSHVVSCLNHTAILPFLHEYDYHISLQVKFWRTIIAHSKLAITVFFFLASRLEKDLLKAIISHLIISHLIEGLEW